MEGLLYKTMFKSETPGTLPQHLLKPERGLGFKAKYGTKRGFAWRQVVWCLQTKEWMTVAGSSGEEKLCCLLKILFSISCKLDR